MAAVGSKMLGAIDAVGMDLIDEIQRGNANAVAAIVDGQGQILCQGEDDPDIDAKIIRIAT